MSNLPDDCQGNGANLPWNDEEQEVYSCWNCNHKFDNDLELTEVKTTYNGFQNIGPCCIEHFEDDNNE